MFYVYIIKSKSSSKFYEGQTRNLKDRLDRHNSGKVRSTKGKGPWELIFQNLYKRRLQAVSAERKIKKRGAARFLSELS